MLKHISLCVPLGQKCLPIPEIAAEGIARPSPHGQAAANTAAAFTHALIIASVQMFDREFHIVAKNAAAAKHTTPETK